MRLFGRRAAAGVLVAVAVAGCASQAAHSGSSSSSPGSSLSPASPSATVSVTVTTTGSSVALMKGQTLQVVVPSQNPREKMSFDVAPAGSAVLVRVPGASGVFTAAGVGTAQVMVTQTPVCSPGEECPAHIVNLGTVNVTVTG